MIQPPDFLDLPPRQSRPRSKGLTHILDKGLSPAATEQFLAQAGHLVDIAKIGCCLLYTSPSPRDS